MDTLLIQITNDKALQLLKDLEDIQLIKVLKREAGAGISLSEKYAGKLPSSVVDDLQQKLNKIREEWDQRDKIGRAHV